jgi:phage-related minor tail protein
MLHERLTEMAAKLGGVYERVADGLLEWWRAAQKAKNATDAVATATVTVKKSFADMWKQMDAGERAMAIMDGIGRVLAALPQKFRKVAQAADVGFNIVRDAIEIAKGNLLAFFDILAQVLSLLGIFGDKVEKEKSAFEKMKDELSDALEDFSRRFAETLATLVREGKAQFGDLVDYILNKLLEITLYYTISYPIEQGIRAAFKGIFSKGGVFNGGGVVPMARGAVITGPVVAPMALMGERGPEAVLPLKRFADGSLGVRAETTGGGVVVNVFNNAGGVEVDTRTTRAADGTRAVEIFVKEAVRAGLMRGDFDAEMRSMYGVRRLGFA